MKIQRNVLDCIDKHARESFPHECCGILLATGRGADVATTALQAENAESTYPRQRYTLDHRAHCRAIEMEARGRGRIVGYYHSHPDGATRPSHRDTMMAAPGVTYLILGMNEKSSEVAAWFWNGNQFIPELVEVLE